MTTDELVRVINNSDFRNLAHFFNRLEKMCPDVKSFSIIEKKDMGLSGILASARFYLGQDEIIVRGFLYETPNWSEETHGYITAKKI